GRDHIAAPTSSTPMSDLGLYVQTACIWEATARKAGNVHRFADFGDVTYLDFILSAAAIAPVMAAASERGVGQTILDAVVATRRVARGNTNLGSILLLAPLAAVRPGDDLRSGVKQVLSGLDVEDARLAYKAIRLAAPGGLGHADAQDVAETPTVGLRQAMALATDRDLIARQYSVNFQDVFDTGVPALETGLQSGSLENAIVGCHLHWMGAFPDTLI